ncbi:O-antigen ligase-like membrane protein [Antricoccus suffuscus]|uniref:O-antigen ligase-like membrane protein n=1 Tax=Antricoccus suffuscus TaxID=1629062 RepID=A0A2T1A1S4_9ACTN|nr:O-antigen ligase family protein [Antricoccus suffuscus]PRZ42484.1 O-antigen ligase-like membrane protein [Antricoccus suffuscus]
MSLAAETPVRRERTQRIPALVFVLVYVALLLCIPSRLIVGPLGASGTPANLWGLAALLWWVCAAVGGFNTGRHSPVRIAIAVLTLAVFASYVSGMSNGWFIPPTIHEATSDVINLVPATIGQINEKMVNAADRGLLSFGGWLGIVLVTSSGLRSWRDLETVAKWLTWLGTFVAALGILQFFTAIDIASFFKIPGLVANSDFGEVATRSVLNRVSSTAIHPIEFGVVMACIFVFALHRAIHNPSAIPPWIPVVCIGIAIPMSVSRSAILTAAIALIIMLISWPPRWRWRALFIAPFAAIALRLMIPGLVGTITSLFTNLSNDPSISGRTDDYGPVFDLYTNHPILGRGLFTFAANYYRILDNQYFGMLVEIGAVGLSAAVALFLIGYFCARGARRRTTNPRSRHLALALSGAIAGVVISYVTFDAWAFPMAAGLTFLLIGMAGAAWQIARYESQQSDPAAAEAAAPASGYSPSQEVA